MKTSFFISPLILCKVTSLLLTLIAFTSHAQELNFDSLLNVNEHYAKQDTIKLNLLNTISSGYRYRDPVKGIETAEQAIILAQKLNLRKPLAEAYNNKGINHLTRSEYPQAMELFEKALGINQDLNYKQGIANSLFNKGTIFRHTNDSMANDYFESALKLFEEAGDFAGVASVYDGLGDVCRKLSNYPKALDWHKKAFRLNEQINNSAGIALSLDYLGLIYKKQSDYVRALECYLKALRISEQLGLEILTASNYSHIASLYRRQDNLPKAIIYYEKAIGINEKLSNKKGLAVNLGNLGNIFIELYDYSKAMEYYKRALSISEQIGKKSSIANVLRNIGNVYFAQSDFSKALECYQKALLLNEQIDSKTDVASNLSSIGNVYSEAPDSVLLSIGINPSEKYTKALEFHNLCLQMAIEIGDISREKEAWRSLSKTYKKQKDFSKAYEAYKKYITLRDSILGEEIKLEMTLKDMQFEFDKKETEYKFTQQIAYEELKQQKQELLLNAQQLQLRKNALELSNKEKDLQHLAYLKQRAELENEKYKGQAKDKRLTITEKEKLLQASQLAVLNREKALQLAEIRSQSLQRNLFIVGATLILIILFFVFYTYRVHQSKIFLEVRNKIARDLHDDVGATLSSISLYSEAAKHHIEKNEQAKAGYILHIIGNNSREMIEDMSDIVWAVNPNNDNFDKLTSRLESHGAALFGSNGTAFQFKANEALRALQLNMTQRKNLYLICKEALNNAVKYAASKTVQLTFDKDGNELIASIKDDGKGFDKDNGKKGNGLKNMQNRAKEMKAQFLISTAQGKGTTITLKIKIT